MVEFIKTIVFERMNKKELEVFVIEFYQQLILNICKKPFLQLI